MHRQDGGAKPKSDDEKKMEAAKKIGEAALELPAVKVLKKKVLVDPLVKKVTDAVNVADRAHDRRGGRSRHGHRSGARRQGAAEASSPRRSRSTR